MIKNIIKAILPFAIVEFFSNRTKKNKQKYSHFLVNEDSVLLEKFKIWIFKPTPKKYVFVGKDCMLNCCILFESGSGEVIIGNNVFIGESTLLCRTKIEFENNIFVAWGVYFYDHDSHSTDFIERKKDLKQQIDDYRNGLNFIENKNWEVVGTKPIKICSNAWIGMNAIILKGITIGEGAIVAAGSVVVKDVEPWTIVAGNPARFVKRLKTF